MKKTQTLTLPVLKSLTLSLYEPEGAAAAENSPQNQRNPAEEDTKVRNDSLLQQIFKEQIILEICLHESFKCPLIV